jgi:hypothetical protein
MCNNRLCFDAEGGCLQLITQAENVRQVFREGRHMNCVLTPDDVWMIRDMSAVMGLTGAEIAQDMGMAVSTVNALLRGYTWSWLTEREEVAAAC